MGPVGGQERSPAQFLARRCALQAPFVALRRSADAMAVSADDLALRDLCLQVVKGRCVCELHRLRDLESLFATNVIKIHCAGRIALPQSAHGRFFASAIDRPDASAIFRARTARLDAFSLSFRGRRRLPACLYGSAGRAYPSVPAANAWHGVSPSISVAETPAALAEPSPHQATVLGSTPA